MVAGLAAVIVVVAAIVGFVARDSQRNVDVVASDGVGDAGIPSTPAGALDGLLCVSPGVVSGNLGFNTVLFMEPTATAREIDEVGERLTGLKELSEFVYVDQIETYKEFVAAYREAPELIDAVEPESLPSSFRFHVDPNSASGLTSSLDALRSLDGLITVHTLTDDSYDLASCTDVGEPYDLAPASSTTTVAGVEVEEIEADELGSAVEAMLGGIPLPVGFSTESLSALEPESFEGRIDRYQLGARVAGAVACTWIEQWVAATESGDIDAATVAKNAIGSSRGWPILIEMNPAGDYPELVWDYADVISGSQDFVLDVTPPNWVTTGSREGLGCE